MIPSPRRTILVALALIAVLCPAAAGQESALDFIQPRLDRGPFTRFCRRLDLDRDQHLIAELLFADYGSALDALARRTDAQANAAGRPRVEDAMMGRTVVPVEELRSLRAAVLEVYRAAWPEADDQLELLVESMESVLTEAQAPAWDPAVQALRRHLWLSPRRVGEMFAQYAGDGVDVLDLLEAARGPGGELASLTPSATDGVAAEYARQLDSLLLETAAAERRGAIDARIARIQRDREASAALEREAVDRWARLYELNQRTAGRIGELAGQQLDEPARMAWLHRVQEATFPWLDGTSRPQRIYRWVEDQEIGGVQRQRIDSIHQAYRSKRREMERQTIELIARGRLELHRMVYPGMDPPDFSDRAGREIYQQLLRNSGQMTGLDNRTTAELDATLTEEQRQALQRNRR